MGLPSNTNENELVRGKNILKCVQMGPARHESYSYQAQPDQEQCKIAIAIPPRGSCRKYGPFNVSGYRIQNLTVLFLCDPQWSFLFSQNLLASTKVAFKYFWRRRIVCSLCAVGSEVIYQLSLGSLRWRSQLTAWFGMDPAPDGPEDVMILQLCNFVTISTNFQVLKYKSHPERLVRSELKTAKQSCQLRGNTLVSKLCS